MESWSCGPHRAEFEPPDVFHCFVRGVADERHVRDLIRIATEEFCIRRRLRIFFVTHFEDGADSFTPGARQFLVTTPMSPTQLKGVLVVGGSLMMRMTAKLLMKAHSLLKPLEVPTAILESMDEARRYMAEIREKEAASQVQKRARGG